MLVAIRSWARRSTVALSPIAVVLAAAQGCSAPTEDAVPETSESAQTTNDFPGSCNVTPAGGGAFWINYRAEAIGCGDRNPIGDRRSDDFGQVAGGRILCGMQHMQRTSPIPFARMGTVSSAERHFVDGTRAGEAWVSDFSSGSRVQFQWEGPCGPTPHGYVKAFYQPTSLAQGTVPAVARACTSAQRPPIGDSNALADWFQRCGFSEAAQVLGAGRRFEQYRGEELSPHLGTASMAFVGVAFLDSPAPGPADAGALVIVGVPLAGLTVWVSALAAQRVWQEEAPRVQALIQGAIASFDQARRAELQRALAAQAQMAAINAGLRAMPWVKARLQTNEPAACAALIDWEDATGNSFFEAFGPGTAPGGANAVSCRAACALALRSGCAAARARGMKHLIGWGKVPSAPCDPFLGSNEVSGVGTPLECSF